MRHSPSQDPPRQPRPIGRVGPLHRAEFVRPYADTDAPVILTDVASRWPAGRWWSFDWPVERFGADRGPALLPQKARQLHQRLRSP